MSSGQKAAYEDAQDAWWTEHLAKFNKLQSGFVLKQLDEAEDSLTRLLKDNTISLTKTQWYWLEHAAKIIRELTL